MKTYTPDDPYRLGFEIVEKDPKAVTYISPEHQQFIHDQIVASRKAGRPCVYGRTFAAKDHPKKSPEREKLNKDPRTSDKKQDHSWVILYDDGRAEYFGTFGLANQRLGEILQPFMPERVPLPFGGGTPPIPGDPDEVVTEGEYAGKTLGEAHAAHFRPDESDVDFVTRRAREIGIPVPDGKIIVSHIR